MKVKITRKVIEPLTAMKLPEDPSLGDIKEIQPFCEEGGTSYFRVLEKDNVIQYQCFNHLEDCWMNVPPGHFIVRGLFGECYPIAPEALEKLYNVELINE